MLLSQASQAQGGWVRLSCADPAFSVEAPAGWTLTPVPGRGARLVSQAGDAVVEVVAWQALRPPATVGEAVREQRGC